LNPRIKYNHKNKSIIRLNFNFPAGVGSISESVDEILNEYPSSVKACHEANISISTAIQLTEKINHTIYQKLGDEVEIDWIDDTEVEINNVIFQSDAPLVSALLKVANDGLNCCNALD